MLRPCDRVNVRWFRCGFEEKEIAAEANEDIVS